MKKYLWAVGILAAGLGAALFLTRSSADLSAAIIVPIESAVRARATEVLAAIKSGNVAQLAALIHPVTGVRFSMYGQASGGVALTPSQMIQHQKDNDPILWGISDGKGDEIWRTLAEHLGDVYQSDYLQAPQIAYSKVLAGGSNSPNQIIAVYGGKPFVSFYFPFTYTYPDEEGNEMPNEMSWRTLSVVFDAYHGQWYAIGIVTDQWTI